MIKTSIVRSPSKDVSQFILEDPFGNFEKHTKDIDSKLMKQLAYNGEGLGKRSQGIINPILVEHRVKHEILGFGGQEEVSDYRRPPR